MHHHNPHIRKALIKDLQQLPLPRDLMFCYLQREIRLLSVPMKLAFYQMCGIKRIIGMFCMTGVIYNIRKNTPVNTPGQPQTAWNPGPRHPRLICTKMPTLRSGIGFHLFTLMLLGNGILD
jgi:hypothetical protein